MSSTTPPKPTGHAAVADVAKALGHEHRIQLLELIAQGPRSVEQLAHACDLTVANASRHLQQLRRVGLARGQRRGKQVFYALEPEAEVMTILQALGRTVERQAVAMRRVLSDYAEAPGSLEAVSREALVARLRDGVITLLDVRPASEYALGHIPGAMNLPFDELEQHLARLPADREIVAYCRGPFCILSNEVVGRLRALGYRVRRLEHGFPEWREAGLAVEVG